MPCSSILFGLLIFALVWSHQRWYASPTPLSRLALLNALVREGRLNIDGYDAGTPDKAESNGLHYSDKAPGTVALALPAFWLVTRALQSFGVDIDSVRGALYSSWWTCIWTLALPGAAGGVALWLWLGRWCDPRAGLVTIVGLWCGSLVLPYATLLFSHTLAIGAIALSMWLLNIGRIPYRWRQEGGETVRQVENQIVTFLSRSEVEAQPPERIPSPTAIRLRLVAGGLCLGMALASEYTAGLAVAGLALYAMCGLCDLSRRGHRMNPNAVERVLCLTLGALPALALIPTYSYACLGNPLILPYSLQASFPEMKEGLYGIKWPSPEIAFKLLLSPTRGLLFWSPFLILAAFGYVDIYRRAPHLFWLTYLIPALQVAVISGRAWDWQAGFCLGPRYLAPVLPLLALPVAFGFRRLPSLGGILVLYSIGIVTLATLTDACPGYAVYNPLTELHLPLLLKADLSPNIADRLGLSPYIGVATFYTVLGAVFWWLWKLTGKPGVE